MKTTKTEQNRLELIKDLIARGSVSLTIKTTRSPQYSNIKSLRYWGKRVAFASGCGYDKVNACTDSLNFTAKGLLKFEKSLMGAFLTVTWKDGVTEHEKLALLT